MITQEIKKDDSVLKKRTIENATLRFPPFERSEAAAAMLQDIMDEEPYPTMDEVMADPILWAKVEAAARNAPIGGVPPVKKWQPVSVQKDAKGRTVSAIPPEEGSEEALDPESSPESQETAPEGQPDGPAWPAWMMREYLLTCAQLATGNADYLEDLSDNELANVAAMSRKRFKTIQEWAARRYPELLDPAE